MIIDIRSQEEYILGHIESAIWIPAKELFSNPDRYLKKEKTYSLYCNSGSKSKKVVEYLKTLGYNCVNLEGGYWHYLLTK